MSDFVLAEGFGNLTDGTHTAGSTREILGAQWASFDGNFSLEDIGDGRKWIKNTGSVTSPELLCSRIGDLTELYVAFRVYPTSFARACGIVAFFDGSLFMLGVGINTSGQIVVGTGATGLPSTLSGSVLNSSALSTNVGTHVEIHIVFNNSTGSIEIFLNGVSDASTSGVDTLYQGAACDIAEWWSNDWYSSAEEGIPNGWKFTDLIVHHGASEIGDAGVYYLPTDEDGTDTDFTPSSGSDHYAMCDEIGPDEDSTYNESDGTSGHRDSYLTPGKSGITILSVGSLVRARKDGVGSASVYLGSVHSGSEDQSGAQALGDDHLTLLEFFDTCPSTSSAWTTAQMEAAEVSVEVV